MIAAVSASAQDRASMESYMCNYVDGKGYEDLMKVAAKWNKWAGENNPAPYAAYVLSPVFATFEEVPEAVWIGFSPTSTGMGAIVDKWNLIRLSIAVLTRSVAVAPFARMKMRGRVVWCKSVPARSMRA